MLITGSLLKSQIFQTSPQIRPLVLINIIGTAKLQFWKESIDQIYQKMGPSK